MNSTPKETDLFKVFQTPDLAILDTDSSLAAKMPELIRLRASLYSQEFRDFVAKITGITDLTDRCDCSINAYVQGGHLLCHDDVIGTRRVSYIIYLTDPDEAWLESDGGALELYPIEDSSKIDRGIENGGVQGIPEVIPTNKILPNFNRMALFPVQPGRSYHSVQEVYADKPRLSISGWYHGPDAPKGSDMASLSQVMSISEKSGQLPFLDIVTKQPLEIDEETGKIVGYIDEQELENDDEAVDEDEPISDATVFLTTEEKSYLSEWVNPEYLKQETLDSINEHFCENSSIQLKDFLLSDKAEAILNATMSADEKDKLGDGAYPTDYSVGNTQNGWSIQGPPHMRRYQQFNATSKSHSSCENDSDTAGILLNSCKSALFESTAFKKLLHLMTTLFVVGHRSEVRRFRAGLDYTVAHFGAMTRDPRLDATLCFVKHIPPQLVELEGGNQESADEEKEADDDEDSVADVWGSGDIGGFECYMEKEEENSAEAAEVYKEGENTEDGEDPEGVLLSVNPGANVLSLVNRDDGVMRFIKYVSAQAPGSRWDISMEYALDNRGRNSDENESGDDGSDHESGQEGESEEEDEENEESETGF